MSTRLILSVCLAALVAGCASQRAAPRDEASAAKSERDLQEFEEKLSLTFLTAADAAADQQIAELRPELALTPEQESAYREAREEQATQFLDQARALLSSLSNSLATAKPASAGEAAPYCIPSKRELWEPILRAQQLSAYDTFTVQQRKERAAKLAEERLNRIDSPLGLNEGQRNRVREILTISEEHTLMLNDDLWSTPDKEMENKRLAMVMTPAQFKKYQKLTASPDSNRREWYAEGFFIPPTFSLPHFGGSFRAH